jgi:hypothetical protein
MICLVVKSDLTTKVALIKGGWRINAKNSLLPTCWKKKTLQKGKQSGDDARMDSRC